METLRMMALRLAPALLIMLVACADARTLCAIGDSIMYGYVGPGARTALPPPAALQALLRRAPVGHRWRFARVQNFGVSGSWTGDWVTRPALSWVCPGTPEQPFVERACANGTSLLSEVRASNVRCDGWIIQLGLNDWIGQVSVEQSADNLAAIRDALAPTPAWIGAPTHATGLIELRRAQLRNTLLERGLLTGVDPPVLATLGGTHLGDGESAALGALWFGVLR
jgi:lysophospholipase L1-like esterase